MKKKIILSAVSLFLVAVLFAFMPFGRSDRNPDSVDSWMSRVSDEKLITEINIPGTHDSLTKFVVFPLMFRTQSKSLTEQLEFGVRYFDFRFNKTDEGIFAVHGSMPCKKSSGFFSESMTGKAVVDDCLAFLESHPEETILFQFKEGSGDVGDKLYTEFYNTLIKGNEDRWFLENRVPSLGEVRGKIVMLRVVDVDKSLFDETNSGINFSNYPYVGSKEIGDYRLEIIADLNENEYTKMYVQDSYKIQMSKKWSGFEQFINSDLDSNNFNISLLSCTGWFTPYLNALYLNKTFMDYELDESKVYGIIATDYVTQEICEKIYSTNY